MNVDLPAYCRRIAFGGELQPSTTVLHALHLAHASHIPFENLDVLLGRPIRLDLDGLQAKLVHGRRGGYCFEHNLLFAAVLQQLGFSVTRCAARVRYRTTKMLPRTHMLLLVEVEGRTWLADVGFGVEGLLLPVPLEPREESRQFHWTYRVVDEPGLSVLQTLRDGTWSDLYAFTAEPQHQVDYEMANHYTATHPSSRFVQTLTVQLPAPGQRTVIRNRELVIDTGSDVTTRVLSEDTELLAVLAETFGLHFPTGTRFAVLDRPA